MKEIAEAVSRISGHRGRRFYASLIRAIHVAALHMPEERTMKEICAEAGPLCGKTGSAVSQDISRAVRDIWEHGDRQELISFLGHDPVDVPSPKDLIIEAAQIFWAKRT